MLKSSVWSQVNRLHKQAEAFATRFGVSASKEDCFCWSFIMQACNLSWD